MGTKKKITIEQVSVLLWLKALNDFNEQGFEGSSFNDKYEAFEAVEDTGFSQEDYDKYVDFWIKNKVINCKNKELSVSKQGIKLFTLIEEAGSTEDNEIQDMLQEKLSKKHLCDIIDFVKKHPKELINLIEICLKGAEIIISLV